MMNELLMVDIKRKLQNGQDIFRAKTVRTLVGMIDHLTEQLAAKETADALLKEAKNLFDGTLELCDEVNSDEWIWRWRVLYYFEEIDVPPHELPEDMKVK